MSCSARTNTPSCSRTTTTESRRHAPPEATGPPVAFFSPRDGRRVVRAREKLAVPAVAAALASLSCPCRRRRRSDSSMASCSVPLADPRSPSRNTTRSRARAVRMRTKRVVDHVPTSVGLSSNAVDRDASKRCIKPVGVNVASTKSACTRAASLRSRNVDTEKVRALCCAATRNRCAVPRRMCQARALGDRRVTHLTCRPASGST